MVKPNIGLINGLIRITTGLTLLSYATVSLIRRPWRQSNILIMLLSAMKVGEGILRYCPVTDLTERTLENSTTKQSQKENPSQTVTENEEGQS
ncbi:YgaP family membrane protein [Salirhabdus salicampi]|uniref:YgaP family membrane protein n=1 Tax=Salirhabdus salicampi TaxID=476102 RepID=UPI0020C307A2|nr:DUF2892 domain-containing protein [Salirhabdus salicampi]MCP8617848.1 DUF2892 domain-containing protein [Salirhabdus salicampi]